MNKTTSDTVITNAFNTKPCYLPGMTPRRSGSAYSPRSAPEIADALVKAMANLPANDVFGERVYSLPDGRFGVPIILSASGLELLACAARQSGWKLHQFILDAAVAKAQDVRTECRRKHIPFADFVDEGRGVCDEKTPAPTTVWVE